MTQGPLRHIPNFLTLLNLLSGCLALIYVFKGNIPAFAILIGASLVFDFLDGFVARLMNTGSELGKQLDSLADMVTFGVVPGAIMHHLFINSVPLNLNMEQSWAIILGYFPFIITLFSALRLGKFNLDTRQSGSFIGMPTPSITIFVTGLALILEFDRFHLTPFILNSWVIAGMCMIISYLLVSEIRVFSIKFNSFKASGNKIQYSFLMASLILVVFLQYTAIPLVIILYLVLSMISNLNKPVNH